MSTLGVHTSMSLQNFCEISGNNKLRNLITQYDQLTLQRKNIEKSTTISKEEKNKQLAQIDNKMNNLNDQITAEKLKEDQKTQQKQSEEEKEQIEDTTDSETAEMRLEAEKLMNMIANATTTDTVTTEATATTSSETDAKDNLFTSSQNIEETADTVSAETDEAAVQNDYNQKAGVQEDSETTDDVYDTIPDNTDHTVAQSKEDDKASALQEEKENNKDNLLFASLLKKFKKGLFIDKKV